MPETLSDDHRWIKFSTTANCPVMVVQYLKMYEEIGRPYRIELDLVSLSDAVSMEDMLGKQAQVTLDDATFLGGQVVEFGWTGKAAVGEATYDIYHALLRPQSWMLNRSSGCRIFQDKSSSEVIEQVFRDRGFTDFSNKCSGKIPSEKMGYCVQYRESDFNFVTRLMEDSGISYYFLHEDNKQTMVLLDGAKSYAASGYDSVPVHPPDDSIETRGPQIYRWASQLQVHSGKYELVDYNFETPTADLTSREKTIQKQKMFQDLEVFDYPGGYGKLAVGKAVATVRMEELESRYEKADGDGNLILLRTGQKFKIVGPEHLRSDHDNVEWVATSAELFAVNDLPGMDPVDERVQFSFQAVKAKVPFKPIRIASRPQIAGPQTAVVTGAKNSEIHTDKYGRIKVQFRWDREGKFDDKSSCWVRVAQTWAGKKWGALYTPRVGQEVIVEFLEGDPDRPIITGMVYNADMMPPYDLPSDGTQSGIKTQSSDKGNAKNFNELRFEDKIGKEHVYFHAERDFERVVENNDVLKVGYDAKDKGDQNVEIYNDQSITLEKGTRTSTVKVGDDLLNIDKGNRTATIKSGDDTVDIKSGAQTTTAGKSILFKVGGNSIKIDQQGVTIDATKITLNAKMKVEAKGTMVEANGSAMLTLKGGMAKIN